MISDIIDLFHWNYGNKKVFLGYEPKHAAMKKHLIFIGWITLVTSGCGKFMGEIEEVNNDLAGTMWTYSEEYDTNKDYYQWITTIRFDNTPYSEVEFVDVVNGMETDRRQISTNYSYEHPVIIIVYKSERAVLIIDGDEMTTRAGPADKPKTYMKN